MDLINYLNEHYYNKQQLLDLAKISNDELLSWQQQKVMPSCSYKIALNYVCDSFFGECKQQSEIEYYAKGYLSWIDILKATTDLQTVYQIFAQRYKDSIKALKDLGYHSTNEKVNAKLAVHIEEEWRHFLNGIYGLCTKSGLPEDIAAKELAILQINELIEDEQLDKTQLEKLTKAVDLLDSASSLFAPHERLKSSRQRLINDVRCQYQLKN